MTSPSRRRSERPKLPPRRVLIAVSAVLLLVVGGWGGWRYLQHREDAALARTVESGLPLIPVLGEEWPQAFERRLERATVRAVSGPNREFALDELSALYYSNGFIDESMAVCRAWLAIAPRAPKAAYRLAAVIGGFGQIDEALPLLDIVIAEAPDYPQGGVRKGELLLKSNRVEEALELFRDVLARHPQAVDARMGIARGLIQEERWAEAREVLLDVTARFPHFGPAWSARATVHQRLGEEEETANARAHGERNRERGVLPDPWIDETYEHCFDNYRLRVAAFAYMPTEMRQREFALRLLRRAISLDPDDLLSWRQMANFFYLSQRWDEARRTLEHILGMAPEEPQHWINLISFLVDRRDVATSRRVLGDALDRFPEAPALWFLEGNRRSQDREYRAAIAAFEMAERGHPRLVVSKIERGRCHVALGEYDQGFAAVEEALSIEPDQPTAGALVAEWWIELKDREKADAAYLRASGMERMPPERMARVTRLYRDTFGSPPPRLGSTSG